MPGITLRIRTQIGTWRVNNVQPKDLLSHIRQRVEIEHNTDLQGKPFSADPSGNKKLSDDRTVQESSLSHGDMIYAIVDETKTAIHEKNNVISRRITKDGQIVAQEYSEVATKNGFRPGNTYQQTCIVNSSNFEIKI